MREGKMFKGRVGIGDVELLGGVDFMDEDRGLLWLNLRGDEGI